MYKHEGILAFGCGCGKGRAAQVPGTTPAARRVTVYTVTQGGVALSEFATLPEARAAAVTAGNGARVKVSSKVQ